MLSRSEAKTVIQKLAKEVWLESAFSSPDPANLRANIKAIVVFDTIRELCDPVMSEAEFNQIIDEEEQET